MFEQMRDQLYPPPEVDYARPPESGGLLSIYPIVDKRPQVAGFYELRCDWYGPTGVGGQVDNIPQYDGDVWSPQQFAASGFGMNATEWQQLEAEQFAPFGGG
jgi:hypothetical protein